MRKLLRRLMRCWRVAGWFVYSAWDVRRKSRNYAGWELIRFVTGYTCGWARGTAEILGMKLAVHGDPGEFPGGLLVGNHLGYLDILVHASIFPIRFAPKKEMKKWLFLGKLTGLNQPIWIDRNSKQKSRETALEMIETLRHNVNLLVYPEGTSTDGKHGMLPFKSTPFEAAVEARCPVQPILTFYSSSDPEAEPMAWFDRATLLPHMWRLLGLSDLRADVYLLPVVRPEEGESRKELAARVYGIMQREYERITADAENQ